MSDLGKYRQLLIVLILLALLVVTYARAAALPEAELLVDPTAPLAPAKASGTDGGLFPAGLFDRFGSYKLSSILIREGDRVAVINARRLRVGESIDNARVTAIEPRRVTLNVDGEPHTLELYANSIKTLVKSED